MLKQELEERLLQSKTVAEFLTTFFGLSKKVQIEAFPEKIMVDEGTTFFRVRKADSFCGDPYEFSQWEPTPMQYSKLNRFNEAGESVLYVASQPDFLEREVGIRPGENYYLAEYTCVRSFHVGSLLNRNSIINMVLHKIAMSISSSDELLDKEIFLVDEYFESVQHASILDLAKDLLSSLYMHRLIPDELYKYTNKIGKIILMSNKNGFRYSSVYAPIEVSGMTNIFTLGGEKYGNYVLTQAGFANIKLKSVKMKKCKRIGSLEILIKEFTKAENQ